MTIYRTQFGSHLYGTDTPNSDFDYKEVFLPDAQSILLGTVPAVISAKRPKEHGEKNQPGDVDIEAFSLKKFLELLAEGQLVALDTLFSMNLRSRDDSTIHPIMWEVFDNRDRILTRGVKSIIGYCHKQAAKYGIKGSRVHALRTVSEFLSAKMIECGANAKLKNIPNFRKDFAYLIGKEGLDHTGIIEVNQVSGESIPHITCCERKSSFTASVGFAHDVYARAFNDYGERARLAEQNESIDWKALSHAVRVGHEAIELLATGNITFPLPNREHILNIKQGNSDYKIVAAEIEYLLATVQDASYVSALRRKADQEYINNLICRVHKEVIDEWSRDSLSGL